MNPLQALLNCLFPQRRQPPCPDLLELDEPSDDEINEWVAYVATQPTTLHHLERCLKQ